MSMHPEVGCVHLGLSWAAVRSGALDEAAVHAAFRSESRWRHPDSRARQSRSHEDFCVLVEARDSVLAAVGEARDSVPAAAARPCPNPNGRDSAIWLKLSGHLRGDVFRKTRDHILSDAMTHPMYARLARLLDVDGFREHVRSCLAEYYDRKANAVRVIRVSASVDGMLRGDVFVHAPLDGGGKLFVPLWHDSVWFEDEGLVFVIDPAPCAVEAHIRDAADRDCVMSIEYRTRPRACKTSAREFVDVEFVLGVSRSRWHQRRPAAESITLHAGGDEFCVLITDTEACPYPSRDRYPNRGIYARDDCDLFSTEQRSDVEVRVMLLD